MVEYPIDRVSGYTIKQLQDAQLARLWNDWKDNIKTKYKITTENVDELFNKKKKNVKLFTTMALLLYRMRYRTRKWKIIYLHYKKMKVVRI
jgi:hypothetical protein